MTATLNSSGRGVGAMACIAVAIAASVSGCSDQATASSYTGIWKANCANYWGVQIKPATDALYTVTFCGLSGCLGPHEWLPDTRIAGDPLYQVDSAGTLRIKRKDGAGYFTYRKCSADPGWNA